MTIYNIGVGIADITDPAIGLILQGMADPSQKTTGVETRLYSRTFIVSDRVTDARVVIVTADIWSCTEAVKTEVISRLQLQHKGVYREDNVLISGTHTHSAPGGFSSSKLYESTSGGLDPHTFECIVSGIVSSIEQAHVNLAPGKIYINKGTIADCGRQRSLPAYNKNPAAERNKYQGDTDNEMILLKFVKLDSTDELPIGALSWYAIHPTDRGQKNTLVTGDNKGFAAALFEQEMNKDYPVGEMFVAAFANANCGDVSGNIEFGAIPDLVNDRQHMELHGGKQFERARDLFNTAEEELEGPIDFRHTRIDMSHVQLTDGSGKRTWPAALGLSFAAGSTEDSVPRIKVGPMVIDSFDLSEGIVAGKLSITNRIIQGVAVAGLASIFGTTDDSPDFIAGHAPKPIVLAPGLFSPPIVSSCLPLQLVRIGNLVLTAVPGELTTMAGRRLRETVLTELKGAGVNHLALATYANDYSQYITTKEEYQAQHYEGASTLFGPQTLQAYQQEFIKIAQALKSNNQIGPGPKPSARTAPTIRRVTFRNLSASAIRLKFFKQSDRVSFLPLSADVHLAAGSDYAYVMPGDVKEIKVQIDNNNERLIEHIKVHQLVTIAKDGSGVLSDYKPPKPTADTHPAE